MNYSFHGIKEEKDIEIPPNVCHSRQLSDTPLVEMDVLLSEDRENLQQDIPLERRKLRPRHSTGMLKSDVMGLSIDFERYLGVHDSIHVTKKDKNPTKQESKSISKAHNVLPNESMSKSPSSINNIIPSKKRSVKVKQRNIINYSVNPRSILETIDPVFLKKAPVILAEKLAEMNRTSGVNTSNYNQKFSIYDDSGFNSFPVSSETKNNRSSQLSTSPLDIVLKTDISSPIVSPFRSNKRERPHSAPAKSRVNYRRKSEAASNQHLKPKQRLL